MVTHKSYSCQHKQTITTPFSGSLYRTARHLCGPMNDIELSSLGNDSPNPFADSKVDCYKKKIGALA